MHKILIIDDEPLARELIRSLLNSFPGIRIQDECADGLEGFKAIQQYRPDLIFLDVQMPKVTGFEMLDLLDDPPDVIFTTAFDEYALKAFEAHAVDYLLKPITRDRFTQAMNKWLDHVQAGSIRTKMEKITQEKLYEGFMHRVVVKDHGHIRIIPVQDIFYLEAQDDYVKIVTSSGRFLKKITLTRMEETLDPRQFVRVHRSYMIAVNLLLRIEPYDKEGRVAVLSNDAKIPVSKAGLTRLKDLLGW